MGHGEEFAHHDAIGGKVRPGGMIMSSLDHAMFTYMNDDLYTNMSTYAERVCLIL